MLYVILLLTKQPISNWVDQKADPDEKGGRAEIMLPTISKLDPIKIISYFQVN